jgi:hypothetical protein
MSTTQTIHSLPRSAAPRSVGVRGRGRPTPVETLHETASLIGAPAMYGPPIIFVLGPWLLLVLLLIPPAAFLITLVLVVAVAAGLLVAVSALVMSPYLLARHAARRRRVASEHRAARPAPAASEVTGPRGWRPVKQPAGAHLVPPTTR